MIQQKQYVGGLLALGISIALQANVSAATEAPAASWLMSDWEVTAHKATMAKLEGQAREDYRNAQYERLRQRALQQGFELPADPPWAGAAAAATQPSSAESVPVVSTDQGAEDAAARHAELREKLQARREALQKDSETSLQRLQKAASDQQKQVEAQMQTLGKGDAGPDTATDKPVAPTMPPETATATPVAAAVTVAETPPMPSPPPVATSEAPTPPLPSARTAGADTIPRFAPVDQTVGFAPPVPEPAPETAPIVVQAPTAPAEPTAPPAPAAIDPFAGSTTPDTDAMAAYREKMRLRFEEYMAEHRVRVEEKARQQREQHEAAMQQNRAMRANRPGYAPYPYPPAPPSYGPRYPAAYPGYRTPYWQQ